MCRSPGSLAPCSSSLPVCNLYHALWGCVPVYPVPSALPPHDLSHFALGVPEQDLRMLVLGKVKPNPAVA